MALYVRLVPTKRMGFFTKKDNNKTEEDFHDEWALSTHIEDCDPIAQFSCATSPEYRYVADALYPMNDKKILVLGCGLGEEAVYCALQGAHVIALDISKRMLEHTANLARRHNVEMFICVLQGSAEQFQCEDGSLDAILACNILHHVDIEKSLRCISRALKPGGLFVFSEPLAYNPLINIYRAMASRVRTDGEHPLTLKDIEVMKCFFPTLELKTFHLFTLGIFVWFFAIERIHPNSERYWKKIIYDALKYERAFNVLSRIDNYLLRIFPFLSRFCWVIAGKGTKKFSVDSLDSAASDCHDNQSACQ